MNPRPDVSEERTAQIIEAAVELFSEKSFDATSMADIADAVGISKSTIYLYFDSKDDLIHAIAKQIFAQELADLQAAYAAAGSASERLTAFYETYLAQEAEVLPLMPIIYEFYALGLRREDVRAVIADYMEQLAARLEVIIQEGVECGEFAPTEPTRVARTFIALVEGLVLQWVYAPEQIEAEAQLRFSIQLLFRGLVAEGNDA